MKILTLNFFVLQILGFWRPENWSSTPKIIIYDTYTCLTFLILYTVTISQLIQLIKAPGNIDDFIDDARILLTMLNACAKTANFIARRSDILKTMEILSSSPCSPQNEAEYAIQEKFDRVIRTNSLLYGSFIQSSVFAVVLQTAMESAPKRILPFKSWLPYDLNSNALFWLTYLLQIIATYLTSLVNICYDTIVPGCMVQTCAQLEIFKNRLKNLSNCDYEKNRNSHKNGKNRNNHENEGNRNSHENGENEQTEREIVSNHAQHHLKILKFAESSNNIFTYTIFIQFSISFMVICVSVYDLSKVQPLSGDFMEVFLYLVSMMLEIFIFCYYGNNVTIESANVGNDIYNLDWPSLTAPVRKSLLIIMTRSMKPLTFTSGHVVILSLASFSSLLKLSYSAYNFLQQAS